MRLRLNYKKLGARKVRIYRIMPDGWRYIGSAATAPIRYKWICNNKSKFSSEYKNGLLKEA